MPYISLKFAQTYNHEPSNPFKKELCRVEIFQIKHFQDLNPAEIYAMYQLRAEVFVVEQQCVFTDPDAYDLVSLHIMGMVQSRLMAYARIVPPGEI